MSALDVLSSGIRDIQSTRYSQLASGTIILYDHLVTLDTEVELIWKSSWSLGKGLFILNRYYGLVSVIINTYGLFSPHLTSAVSLHFFRWQGWTGLIACMISEIILQMRLYALYSLNKRILALMGTCFILAVTVSAAIMGTVLSKITATAVKFSSDFVFCVPSNVSGHFFAFWIPMLAFETLLCGLALFRGFQTFKSSASPFRSGKHLVGILIRDSILYFLVMFATYLTCLLVWTIASQNLLEIPIGFSVALSCVMGNRIILNVREVNKELEAARTTSQKAVTHASSHASSHTSTRSRIIMLPGETSLTDIEMAQLRSLRDLT